jgi:TonB-dependent receptor
MLAEQRQSMNIKQVISADNFGDMSEQNVGELLKYLPGVVIDYVETDTRAAGLGGMDPKYGYVTLDGNSQASGSSGAFGGNDRQFEFESVSMNNIESIEFNRTLTPDMWGDAPAGTVNLRTRSSLDRRSPTGSVSGGFIWNSIENGFSKTPRPDDGVQAKTRPRLSFDYNTGAILDGKLGFSANASTTSIFKEQFRHSTVYDYGAGAAAVGQPLVTGINYKDGPKIVDKHTGGFRVDYQPFFGLRMSVASSYSWFSDFFANRNLNFTAGGAPLATSSSNRLVASGTSRVDQSGETTGKLKDNTNLSYAANWKRGGWSADLALTYSRARERRGGLYYHAIGNTPIRISNVGFTAERPDNESAAWTINQTSGLDWYDLNNWRGNGDFNSNAQYGKTEQYSGRLDVKRVMDWEIPTSFKVGFGKNVTFKHRWVSESFVGRYLGNTGSAATALMPISKATFLTDEAFGGGARPYPVPDKEALFALYRTRPNLFVQTEANLANQLLNVIGSYNGNQEDITAGYVMAEHRLFDRAAVVYGVRFEGTNTRSKSPGQLPDARNPFAFFDAVNNNFEPPASLTRNYVAARYGGQAPKKQYGEYDNYLPSAALKYNVTSDFIVKAGFNKAIKRPDLNRIGGPITVNYDDVDDEYVLTVPNPGLRPENSERYSLLFEHYLPHQGNVSLHVYQTNIDNSIDEFEFNPGFDISDYPPNTIVRSFRNLNTVRRYRCFELSYSQRLGFFENRFLRAFSINGSYSQFNVTPRPRNGTRFVPRVATGGVSWTYGKIKIQANGTWTDETFVSETANVARTASIYANEPEYFKERLIVFVSGSYQLTDKVSVFVSGDRAYDSGKIWYFKSDNRIRQIENYGSQWSMGVRVQL